MLAERIRYSKSFPKNTLLTLKDEDTLYFGISRCNLKAGDKTRKSLGKTIAKARALRAKAERMELPKEGMLLHESGLRGVCSTEKIRTLLEYFYDVDRIMQEDAK